MNIDRLISDGQDPKVVEKLLLKLQDMLFSTGEQITYVAVQKKPAVTLFPDSIILTNRRAFICKSTKLGLANDFEVFPWEAIRVISFKEGILGATVVISPVQGEPLEIGYIPKNQARKLYQLGSEALAKPVEEPMIEPPAPQERPAVEEADELTTKLKRLKTLFEQQLISQEEYENKKSELLSQL